MKRGIFNVISKTFIIALCVFMLTDNNLVGMAAVENHDADVIQTEMKSVADKNVWVGDIKEKNLSYLDERGEKVRGLKEIEDKTYYFNEEGIVQTGWQMVEEEIYYFSEKNGERYENGTYVVDGISYIFDENGVVGGTTDIPGDGEEGNVETPETGEEDTDVPEIGGEVDTDDPEIGGEGNVEAPEIGEGGNTDISGNEEENGDNPEEGEGDETENKQEESDETGSADKEADENVQIYKGWHWDSGWYYYDEQGNQLFDWQKIDGNWYYLDGNNEEKPGVMLADCSHVIRGRTYFFEGGGVMLTGWVKRPEGVYYADINGAMQTGWIKSGKYWYYLNPYDVNYPGIMASNQQIVISGHTYFFEIDGRMQTGWVKRPEGWYYTDENGMRLNGWQQIGKYWYYLDSKNEEFPGLMAVNGKKVINGHTYFFTGGGEMQSGWIRYPEGWYYAYPGGNQRLGWAQIGKYWYYLDSQNKEYPGLMAVNGKKEINGYTYFFTGGGEMQTGWIKYPEGYYYAHPGGNQQKNGWLQLGKNWYYLDGKNEEYPGLRLENCELTLGEYQYAFKPDGVMRTGWWFKPGEGYHFYDVAGYMRTGWVQTGGKWYYLDPKNNNIMLSNQWYRNGQYWYYLKESGEMATGWLTLYGNKYWLSTDGVMRTGWQTIDGYQYYFYKENDENSKGWGVMAKNTIIDDVKIGPDGKAATAKDTLDKIYDVGGVGIWNTDYIMTSSQRSALNAAIAAFENRGWPVSFVLVDINTGQGISYNPTRPIYSASCIKGPYVMSLLNAGCAPDSEMFYAIKYSDNNAYGAIRNYYGSSVFANWLSRAGVSTSQASSWYVTTSALDIAKMWLYGYQTLFGVNASYSSWARSTFQGVLYSPISSSLSGANTVYSKSGWIDEGGYYNVHTDGSIVTDGKNPYVLAIMSGAPGIAGAPQMRNLASQLDAIHHEMTR